MTIQGHLKDMSLPTIIQMMAHDGVTAKITLEHEGQKGTLFLEQGQLCHAQLQNGDRPDVGEPAVYALLSWLNGDFTIEQHIRPPEYTIQTSWDYLLIEGMRQVDEQQTHVIAPEVEEDLLAMLDTLSHEDKVMMENLIAQHKENDTMASKSEQLRTILNNIVTNSSDIQGAVIVDNDGLLLASALSSSLDGNRVAAVSAGLVSLASRSAQQLGQGDVVQTLIQAKNGNVIAIRAGAQASFVALTSSGVNLGMAFLECRDAAEQIQATF
jgi:predicted regulator of Ras-like GTPase activity (Roadblock/LC7/MglB family)